MSSSGTFTNGQELVRATPITNAPVPVTNLTVVATNVLTLTNTSTSTLSVSNEVSLNGDTLTPVGDTNLVFSTNTETIGSNVVTIGTNIVLAGTNTNVTYNVGTNTTVTSAILTNAAGVDVGTNYTFISYTLTTSNASTNILGTPSWYIYTPKPHNKGTLAALSTNVLFNIYTDHVHDDGTNLARIHGETVTKNLLIKFGTTDEIRTFVVSNATLNVKLEGYAQGKYIHVILGGGASSYSQNYNWTGNGSGTSNTTALVITGTIDEDYIGPLP